MKQIPVTEDILQKLRTAGWEGQDASAIAVYEAIALNTLPIRKRHPVYKDGVHTKPYLDEMARRVNRESIPLQIQHDDAPLPVGRAFHAQVVAVSGAYELRTLFWVDKTHTDIVKKIDNSTVDQVSVSAIAKHALCNKCGFDFLGEDATFDNFWTGTDPDGHKMGEDGAHVILDHLDKWFELSLVGQGGLPNARIVSNADAYFSDARLAASGGDPSRLMVALNLSSDDLGKKEPTVADDNTKLITDLTDAKADLKVAQKDLELKDTQIEGLNTKLEAANTRVSELEAELVEAKKDDKPDQTSTVAALSDQLTAVAKNVLALRGDVTTEVPTEADALVEFVKTQMADVKLSVSSSSAHSADSKTDARTFRGSAAFKANR